MPTKPAQKKAAEKAKLQAPGELVIRIQGTEEALARITALLMFAEAPFVREAVEAQGPLPWEAPVEMQSAIPLNIDYEAVRRAVLKVLEAYVQVNGADKAREILKSFGGEKLSLIPTENLVGLHGALHFN